MQFSPPVTATFLAGDRVELSAAMVTAPVDPEEGDAEYWQIRAVLAVARKLRRGNPSWRFYMV